VTAWSRQVLSDNDLATRSRENNGPQRGFTWLHAYPNPVLAEPGSELIGVPGQVQLVDCDPTSRVHDGR
jgi:hypothetical protein